jgi:putative ABC transport system permease protein
MLGHDLRYSLRTLSRSPGFTLATALTLALGIGATTAIFSVVDGVLLQPLGFPQPERIVQLFQVFPKGGKGNFSDPNFADVAAQSQSFSALAEFTSLGSISVSGGAEPVRAHLAMVSKDFFAGLGVAPASGRLFVAQEQQPGGSHAVLVSHGFWQRVLGGVQDLSGLQLRFQEQTYQVVGVMRPGFEFPEKAELWVPRELEAPLPSRTAHNWKVLGRLRDGVPLGQAQQEVSAIARRLKAQYGDDTWMTDAAVVPLHEQTVGRVRPALLLLLGAAGVLLLIACANVANLLLARLATRGREIAVRRALGAGSGQLARQFFVESLLLALPAGGLGLLLAIWGTDVLQVLGPRDLPRLEEIRLHWPVVAFALAVSVATAVALGLTTALRGRTADLRGALAQSQRTVAGAGGSGRLRSGLVVAQVALTLVLLAGAGLLGRSFLHLLAIDPGYRMQGAVVLDLALPWPQDAAAGARQSQLEDELLSRLRAIPGVEQAGGVNSLPLTGGGANGKFLILPSVNDLPKMEDFERLMKDESRTGDAEFRVASDGYFRAMNIPLLRGRMFEERDSLEAPHVALISESLARTRWPAEEALGKVIEFGNMDGDPKAFTVVGIVGDIREESVEAEPRPTFYGNSRQRPGAAAEFHVVLQGSLPETAVTGPARAILRELAPEVPPNFRTLEEISSAALASRRFSLFLLGVFAGTALLLAVMGLYGLVSYVVAQRTQEIGVRVAFGAQARDIRRLVLRHGARLAGLGIGVGLLASLGLTRLLEGLLYGVSATDPGSFGAMALLLAAVTLLASWVPARRASRLDPMAALRAE